MPVFFVLVCVWGISLLILGLTVLEELRRVPFTGGFVQDLHDELAARLIR